MYDPTIFEILNSVYFLAKERIDNGESIEDILKDEAYKEEERKLKEDIARGRLKPNPLTYFIMTINMKGRSLGPGTAEHRRTLLTILVRNFPCSVIFSQEQNQRGLTELFERHGLETRRNGEEAAVIWNGSEFEGTDEGLQGTDARIRKLRDEIQRQHNELDLSDVLSRIKMVKLTRLLQENEEGENLSFLAVSWHGPHKINCEEKRGIFRGLQEFVKRVSGMEGNIPFVIGGDFNLNTLHDEFNLSNNVTVSSYPLSPRKILSFRKSPKFIPYKDNFMFSTPGIMVTWVRPIDFTSSSEQTQAASDLSRKEQDEVEDIPVNPGRGVVDDLLDHDPVVGVLELSNLPSTQTSVARNLEEQF